MNTQLSTIGFAIPKHDFALFMHKAKEDSEKTSNFMQSAFVRECVYGTEEWISMFWPNIKWDERLNGHKFIKDYKFYTGNSDYQFLKVNTTGSNKVQIEWHNTSDIEPLFPIGSWL